MASTSVVPTSLSHPELNNKQTGNGVVLTFSWPSARPSRPSVCRPWLRCQSPSFRSVLRRLVPLRLSCSFSSLNRSPQRLSRASPMEIARAQLLSRRVFRCGQSKWIGLMTLVDGLFRRNQARMMRWGFVVAWVWKRNRKTTSRRRHGRSGSGSSPDPCDVTKGNSNLQ